MVRTGVICRCDRRVSSSLIPNFLNNKSTFWGRKGFKYIFVVYMFVLILNSLMSVNIGSVEKNPHYSHQLADHEQLPVFYFKNA